MLYRETAIAAAAAAVYYFDQATTSWNTVDGGMSAVYIYENAEHDAFRVVAMSQTDNRVICQALSFHSRIGRLNTMWIP